MNWTGGRLRRHSKPNINKTVKGPKHHFSQKNSLPEHRVAPSPLRLSFAPIPQDEKPALPVITASEDLSAKLSSQPDAYEDGLSQNKTVITLKHHAKQNEQEFLRRDSAFQSSKSQTSSHIPQSVPSGARSLLSSPLRGKFTKASSSLRDAKNELLERQDWLTLDAARPLEITFPDVRNMEVVGRKRRRLEDRYRLQDHTETLLFKGANILRRHEESHHNTYKSDVGSMSIRIGSNIHQTQTTMKLTREMQALVPSISSPCRSTSEPMLLDKLEAEAARGSDPNPDITYGGHHSDVSQARATKSNGMIEFASLEELRDYSHFDSIKQGRQDFSRQEAYGPDSGEGETCGISSNNNNSLCPMLSSATDRDRSLSSLHTISILDEARLSSQNGMPLQSPNVSVDGEPGPDIQHATAQDKEMLQMTIPELHRSLSGRPGVDSSYGVPRSPAITRNNASLEHFEGSKKSRQSQRFPGIQNIDHDFISSDVDIVGGIIHKFRDEKSQSDKQENVSSVQGTSPDSQPRYLRERFLRAKKVVATTTIEDRENEAARRTYGPSGAKKDKYERATESWMSEVFLEDFPRIETSFRFEPIKSGFRHKNPSTNHRLFSVDDVSSERPYSRWHPRPDTDTPSEDTARHLKINSLNATETVWANPQIDLARDIDASFKYPKPSDHFSSQNQRYQYRSIATVDCDIVAPEATPQAVADPFRTSTVHSSLPDHNAHVLENGGGSKQTTDASLSGRALPLWLEPRLILHKGNQTPQDEPSQWQRKASLLRPTSRKSPELYNVGILPESPISAFFGACAPEDYGHRAAAKPYRHERRHQTLQSPAYYKPNLTGDHHNPIAQGAMKQDKRWHTGLERAGYQIRDDDSVSSTAKSFIAGTSRDSNITRQLPALMTGAKSSKHVSRNSSGCYIISSSQSDLVRFQMPSSLPDSRSGERCSQVILAPKINHDKSPRSWW